MNINYPNYTRYKRIIEIPISKKNRKLLRQYSELKGADRVSFVSGIVNLTMSIICEADNALREEFTPERILRLYRIIDGLLYKPVLKFYKWGAGAA